MAGYKVYFRESVEKDFRARPEGSPRGAIPKKDLKRILQRIQSLSVRDGVVKGDALPQQGGPLRISGYEKLTGQERYRLRQGHYRIVYSIQDKDLTVWIVKVAHRKDVYR